MRKRAALARMLIYEPETFLLDEPFGALDAQLKLIMHQELLRLTRAQKLTVVFVTHDLAEAITLADRVLVLHRATRTHPGGSAKFRLGVSATPFACASCRSSAHCMKSFGTS